jgi:hypothetical protein
MRRKRRQSLASKLPFRLPLLLRVPMAVPLCSGLCLDAALAQDDVPAPTEPATTAPAQPGAPPETGPVVESGASSTGFAPGSASGSPYASPMHPLGGTSQLSTGPSATPFPLGGGLFQLGPVTFHPHLVYELSYGNGLQSAPGQRTDSWINTVSPGIFLGLGSHWSLDYTPTLRFYSTPHLDNALDHVVHFGGGTTYNDWVFALSQDYSLTSQPLIETGGQTDQELFGTSLSAVHALSSKMSLDLGVNQVFRFISQPIGQVFQATDTREWSTMDWLNYQFVPRFTFGVGLGFTYDQVTGSPDMTSERYQGRINWLPTDKLSFTLAGGLEDRQFLSSPQPDLLSPIFSLTAAYHLFEDTTFSASAQRTVSPSYYSGSLSEATSLTAGLHQRLLRRFLLDVTGSYTTTTYHSGASLSGVAAAGSYDYTSFEVRLGTALMTRGSISVFFQETFVSSSSTGVGSNLYNYTTTQGGLSFGYRF